MKVASSIHCNTGYAFPLLCLRHSYLLTNVRKAFQSFEYGIMSAEELQGYMEMRNTPVVSLALYMYDYVGTKRKGHCLHVYG